MPYRDPEVAQAYNREYKRSNRWRYRTRQKSYDAAKHANLRAAGFGVDGTITPEDVEGILSIRACYHCGSAGPLEIDHLAPMDKGGANHRSNLVASCGPCNKSKKQGPAPWRWSHVHDHCQGCGTTDRRHLARGYCSACYQARFRRRDQRRSLGEGFSATGN